MTRDKETHFIMIKQSIHQDDITITNIHAPNNRMPKYVMHKLTKLKGATDNQNNTPFQYSVSTADRTICTKD